MESPSKKVNFLISYNDTHSCVKEIVRAIHSKHHVLFLSPTEDTNEAYYPQLVAIEVQTPDGGYLSSSLQLATWLAVGLEKVRQLNIQTGASCGEDRSAHLLMLLMGVTVMGNF